MRLGFVGGKDYGLQVLPMVRLLLLCGISALVGIADSVSSPYFCPLVRWLWGQDFSAGRKCKKIKVNFPPKGPRIWRRHLWIHHFCKVWYSGKFAINLMTKACTPDFRHLGPGPHDEEVGCQEHLSALIGDRLHIQHNLLRGGPR